MCLPNLVATHKVIFEAGLNSVFILNTSCLTKTNELSLRSNRWIQVLPKGIKAKGTANRLPQDLNSVLQFHNAKNASFIRHGRVVANSFIYYI